MQYAYIKAIHIVFIVTWFAALFYMVRLFIYTAEAQKKEKTEKDILTAQFIVMQRRLWFIIGWPGMIGSLVFGLWMLYMNVGLLKFPWMWLKLISVTLLILYHIQCQRIYNQQSNGEFRHSSFRLRMFNELATLFLVAIVFLVVVKSNAGLLWGLLGLILFAGALYLFIKIYRSTLEKHAAEHAVSNKEEKKEIKG